jgi:hypothetical protein
VGHRALVAIETAQGKYDLHYAHDGAHEWRLATADTTGRLRTDGDASRSDGASVDPAPLQTGCSFEGIVTEHVDFQQYEALYRVPTSGVVEPFLVCWFGLPGVGVTGPREGALVGVDPERPLVDGEFLRGWFAGVSGLALVLVDEGDLAPDQVPALFESHLRSWASDRELHVVDGE